ncbi:MAG: (2Fe-2S)-binding protein [Candidatus Meridianibacter frigidus]|nr:MAG: (2Fe-2S)-binding protein [Candidatus Eremiobacteraeota bacterium]
MDGFTKASVPKGARTLAQSYYVSAEIFKRERERLFAHHWICVGRSAQLARAGQFFTCSVADESLIVVRGDDAQIRAFYNVCRHRGTRLCTDSSGEFKATIQCPYHAWTYALDGTLRFARNMAEVDDFRTSECRLREARICELHGFLFANLEPHAAPLDASLTIIGEKCAPWKPAQLPTVARITYHVACNWKLVFQNYSECYHCPVIHPQLEKISAWDSGRNDLLEGPVLGGYSVLRDAPLNENRVYYYTVFPSLLLSFHPDYIMVHYVQPLAADRTEVVCEWLSSKEVASHVDFWDLTNRQDWAVNERTQLGVASRAYEPGPYAQSEGLLYAFDRHYLATLNQV